MTSPEDCITTLPAGYMQQQCRVPITQTLQETMSALPSIPESHVKQTSAPGTRTATCTCLSCIAQ